MDTQLDADERMVRDQARTFLAESCPTSLVRACEAARSHDAKLWSEIVRLGWLETSLPEEAGGLGLPLGYCTLLCEEVGRHLAPIPLLGVMVPLLVLSKHAGTAHADTLAAVRAGRSMLSFAIQEADGAWSAEALLTRPRTTSCACRPFPQRPDSTSNGMILCSMCSIVRSGRGTALRHGVGQSRMDQNDLDRPGAPRAQAIADRWRWPREREEPDGWPRSRRARRHDRGRKDGRKEQGRPVRSEHVLPHGRHMGTDAARGLHALLAVPGISRATVAPVAQRNAAASTDHAGHVRYGGRERSSKEQNGQQQCQATG